MDTLVLGLACVALLANIWMLDRRVRRLEGRSHIHSDPRPGLPIRDTADAWIVVIPLQDPYEDREY
jgi:hypothetical protein